MQRLSIFNTLSKLVRDKIPEIISKSGHSPNYTVANDEEYQWRLYNKLQEEIKEFKEEPSAEELADILEVLYAIADYYDIPRKTIKMKRKKKLKKKGGFKEKFVLYAWNLHNSKLLQWILILGLFIFQSCKKTEILHTEYLDITKSSVEVTLKWYQLSSHYIIDYHADPLSRIYWTSSDSFDVLFHGDLIKTAVVDYSTYTREDGTGSQLVYYNKTHIGDTLDIYARGKHSIDSIKIIVK